MIKILLALDLDYTHFISGRNGIWWIGSKEFWLALYEAINNLAEDQKVTIVFAIVTSKKDSDDLTDEAAKTFRLFLEKHNPHMYKNKGHTEWYLTNLNEKLTYIVLNGDQGTDSVEIPEYAFANFEIVFDSIYKSAALRRLTSVYDIPPERCVLLDDSPFVLKLVKNEGFRTVSCECFNMGGDLEDDEYVENHLQRIKVELISEVQKIIFEALPDTVKNLELFNKVEASPYFLLDKVSKSEHPCPAKQALASTHYQRLYFFQQDSSLEMEILSSS
ncbi:MAG: hypothetical protein H0U73_06180, partial [Tatlockia sp.]|nr:hypothetical protein [Tatlockia sp.]